LTYLSMPEEPEIDGITFYKYSSQSEINDYKRINDTMLSEAYSVYTYQGGEVGSVRVQGGTEDTCLATVPTYTTLLPKGKNKSVSVELLLQDTVTAPVLCGDAVGELKFCVDGKTLTTVPVSAANDVPKISFWQLFCRMLGMYLLK